MARGRKPKYSERLRDKCADLLREGKSLPEIQEELRRDGDPVPSTTWIYEQNGRARAAERAGRTARQAMVAALETETEPDAVVDADEAADADWRAARESARDLRAMAKAAKAEGDMTQMVRLERAMHTALALASKLRPTRLVPLEERADMVEAARLTMEKIDALITRERERRREPSEGEQR